LKRPKKRKILSKKYGSDPIKKTEEKLYGFSSVSMAVWVDMLSDVSRTDPTYLVLMHDPSRSLCRVGFPIAYPTFCFCCFPIQLPEPGPYPPTQVPRPAKAGIARDRDKTPTKPQKDNFFISLTS
jgi:hypothetical protein